MSRNRGFTLLEIMIALVVFATVAVAVQQAGAMTTVQMARSEEHLLAAWVARDALTRMVVEQQFVDAPPIGGDDSRDVQMAGRTWTVDTSVSTTSVPEFRRVEIVVRTGDKGREVARTLGFIGTH